MAYSESKYIDGLDIATTLDGSEIVPLFQDGLTKQTTVQEIADLTDIVNIYISDGSITEDRFVGLDNHRLILGEGQETSLDLNPANKTSSLGDVNGNNNSTKLTVDDDNQTVSISTLIGTDTRIVEANSSGILSATQIVSSGVFTSSANFGNITNVTSSSGPVSHWQRIGAQVQQSGSISIVTIGAGATELSIQLPIGSDITLVTDVTGVGTTVGVIASSIYVEGSTSGNTARLKFIALGAGTVVIYFTFMYTII